VRSTPRPMASQVPRVSAQRQVRLLLFFSCDAWDPHVIFNLEQIPAHVLERKQTRKSRFLGRFSPDFLPLAHEKSHINSPRLVQSCPSKS
jgi:hypothetical protein